MAYVKAAIFTTLLLICALLGFVFFQFGSEYQVNVAFDAFEKGQYEKAAQILTKLENEAPESRLFLYHAYVLRAQHQLDDSTNKLTAALQYLKAHERREVNFEILLNQAYNDYLAGKPDEMRDPLREALNIFNDNTYLHLLIGLEHFSKGEYERSLFQWNRAQNRIALSEWMKKAFDSTFSPMWLTLHSARCYIELNQPLQARQMLEKERDEANPDEQTAIAFLMGLSYAKEAEAKVAAAAAPYYKLALSYFNRVPLQDPRYTHERETVMALLKKASDEFINRGLYEELAIITTTFEAWHQDEAVEEITHKLIALMTDMMKQDKWDKAFDLASVINRLLPPGAARDELSEQTDQAVRHAFATGQVDNLPEMWEIAKFFSKDATGLTREMIQATTQKIVRAIADEKVHMEAITGYVTFWQKMETDPARRLSLALRLLEMSEPYWMELGQEERALDVMILAERLPLSNQQDKFRESVKKILTRVLQNNLNEQRIAQLPYLLKAADRFRLDSLGLKSPEAISAHLDTAKRLQAEGKLQLAKDHTLWVLTLEPNQGEARLLLALIDYDQGNYQQASQQFQQLGKVPAEWEEAKTISDTLSQGNEASLNSLSKLSPDGKVRLAIAYLRDDQPEKSLKWLADPLINAEEAHAISAFAHFEHGDYAEALSSLDNLPSSYRELAPLKGIAILSLAASGKLEEAQTMVTPLISRSAKAIPAELPPLFRQLLAQRYANWTNPYIVGRFYKDGRKDNTMALSFFEKIDPPTPEAQLEMGDLYLQQGNRDQAIKMLSEALHERQSGRFVRKAAPLLAELANKEGRYDEALKFYRELIKLDGSQRQWLMGAAQASSHLQRWDWARQCLEEVRKLGKMEPEELVFLAEAGVHNRSMELAMELAQKWTEAGTIPLVHRLRLARILFMARSPAQVANLMDPVASDDVKLSPEERLALFNTLLYIGDLDRAERLADSFQAELMNTQEGVGILVRLKRALGKKEEALALARQRHLQGYLDAHETDPKLIRERIDQLAHPEFQSVSALLRYTDQLIHLGEEQNDKSQDSLLKAIRLLENIALQDKDYPQVYFQLGKAYQLLDQGQKALENFQQALVLSPSFGETYGHLAQVLEKQGRYKAAAIALQSAVYWNPNQGDGWMALAKLSVAMKNLYDAKAGLSNVVRYEPNNTQALIRLGRVLLDMKNPEDAKNTLERAIALEPNNLQALTLLLFCLYDPTLQLNAPDRKALTMQQEETLHRIRQLDPSLAEDLQQQLDLSKSPSLLQLTQ